MRRSRALATIYLRLFVPFAIALLLGTVAAWWIGTTLLASTLEDRVAQQLRHATEVVAEPDFPVNESVLLRLNKLLQASVYLLDAEGNMIPPAREELPTELPGLLRVNYLPWLDSSDETGDLRLSVNGRDYLFVLSRSGGRWQPQYRAVVAFADLSDVQGATRQGGVLLAVLAIIGISLLALLGHWIARSITEPVGELARMAADIAGGDRNVRVDVAREDEIGALAHSLNSMAARLAQYESQVAEQSRLVSLGELSGKVAHEIRNPLTAIKMQLQMFEDELPDSAGPRLKTLLDEVRRLELIVDTTLQLGRPQQLQRDAVDLNDLVSSMLDLMGPQLAHKGIDLTSELASEMGVFSLDANRVKQVLLNLLNNAAEELPDGGQIKVCTGKLDGGGVLLEVADSGRGISPQRRQSLFEQSGSSKPTGYGLGLRVTRELVELHGGTIKVLDSELGGARFRVCFPPEK